MTKAYNPYCQPLLDFNLDKTSKINDICAPLEQHFGITAFFYARMFDNGRYIFVSNNTSLLEVVGVGDNIFNTEYFRQQPDLLCKHEPLVDVWPEDVNDSAMEFLRARGLYNGFSILREFEGSVEVGTFSNNDKQSGIKEFYRKHTRVLDDFLTHFRTVGGDLTNPEGPANLGVSPHLMKAYPEIDKIFKTTTPWERKIIEFNKSLNSRVRKEIHETGRRYSLTVRELECLSYLTAGKTAKEIARIINAAPRTVETHINNIRLKTGCQTKRELTDWFEQTFKPFLGNHPMNVLV